MDERPPSGAVTFLFTDIEGSTRVWEHHAKAMRAALVRHNDLLREAIEARGGYVFNTLGDAFCAAFADAADALCAAIDAQRALHGEPWSAFADGFPPLRVRMGLHTGEAELRRGDYIGRTLNRVARLQDAGNGGQILLSQATTEIVAASLPDGVRLRTLGEHWLRDLRHSEHVTQVVPDSLPDVTRALRTMGELSAADRILVTDAGALDEPTSERERAAVPSGLDVPDTLAALQAVMAGDARLAALTPGQLRAAAHHRPADLTEYRLTRIAEWSLPQYRLSRRFVALTLLIDQGEAAVSGRWQVQEEHYNDIRALLAAAPDPAFVLLGPPGTGKSTLLRRAELDTAAAALRGDDPSAPVTFFVPLNQYKPPGPAEPLPAPREWLSARWAARYPRLPTLESLMADGRVLFLLDALNEQPATSEADFFNNVRLWKDFLVQMVERAPGNRAVLSCRTLDYSATMSTPALRVPQVRIEPLTDEQVRQFLKVYCPLHWRGVWEELRGTRQLGMLRSPFFLRLLTEQVEPSGAVPTGRASLLTGFVRRALRREVEWGHPSFQPGRLLTARDARRVTRWLWRTPWDLPEHGLLVPRLARLAHAMQTGRSDGEQSQVRIDLADALAILEGPETESIVTAGAALAVLDEDEAAGEVMFVHQLVQEYFAAREMRAQPDPEQVRVEWRAARISPSASDVIDDLDLADPLPMLPQTGWEETAKLAAAMSNDPYSFVSAMAQTNLPLAAECAAEPEARERMSGAVLDALRWQLVDRCRNPEADLRHRLACARVLGAVGDPRLERRLGRHGLYIMPPTVEISGGAYPLGDDDAIAWTHPGAGGTTTAHMPRHTIEIAPFEIGRFPVTNAEWACFVEAGGYDDERWWDTEAGRAWRGGALAHEGVKRNNRMWHRRFRVEPELFDQMVSEGRFSGGEAVERWRRWVTLDDEAFEHAIGERWKPGRQTEPEFWGRPHVNHPLQPVVGVCWYEARAYCSWLSAQSGLTVRLPTEAEWEVVARGREGRRYAWGDPFGCLNGNTIEAHIRQMTPVGVFPGGDTPEGVADMTGNVYEWTSSLFGPDPDEPAFRYPYDPRDGREDPEASNDVRRVVRGGAWDYDRTFARPAHRGDYYPDGRGISTGFRIVVAQESPPE